MVYDGCAGGELPHHPSSVIPPLGGASRSPLEFGQVVVPQSCEGFSCRDGYLARDGQSAAQSLRVGLVTDFPQRPGRSPTN